MWKKTISETSFACGIVSIFFQFFCRKMLIKFSYIGTAVAIILFYNHESQEFFIWIQVYALRRAFVNWRIPDLTKFNLRAKFGSCNMRHYRFVFFWFRCCLRLLSHLQVSHNKLLYEVTANSFIIAYLFEIPRLMEKLWLKSQLFSEALQSV